jgi:hypothetical protein
MHQLTGPKDAIKTVNFWIGQGVDYFKIYNFITSGVHANSWNIRRTTAKWVRAIIWQICEVNSRC